SFINLFMGSLQVDELHLWAAAKLLAIAFLQRRPCQDHIAMISNPLLHLATDHLYPWRTIDIVQWNTQFHFFDIFGRVKNISVYEFPTEIPGQHTAGCSLADSSRAHDDQDHWNFRTSNKRRLDILGRAHFDTFNITTPCLGT